MEKIRLDPRIVVLAEAVERGEASIEGSSRNLRHVIDHALVIIDIQRADGENLYSTLVNHAHWYDRTYKDDISGALRDAQDRKIDIKDIASRLVNRIYLGFRAHMNAELLQETERYRRPTKRVGENG